MTGRRLTIIEWLHTLSQAGGSLQGERGLEGSPDDPVRRPLVVAVDPTSGTIRPWLAPKSIVGSLAAHVRLVDGDVAARRLLGDPLDGTVKAPSPSRVRVLGSRVDLPADRQATWQFRGAQHRWSGAAKAKHLVRQEWLPEGTAVTTWAVVEEAMLGAESFPTVVDLLVSLTAGGSTPSWSPTWGAGKSIGHGRAELHRIRRLNLDLDLASDLTVFLGGLGPTMIAKEFGRRAAQLPTVTVGAPQLPPPLITLRWSLNTPLHVGNGSAKEEDHQRAVVLRNAAGHPVIPGSTWKGLLRSRCEFILRSLGVGVCEAGISRCIGCPTCCVFGGVVRNGGGSGWASRVIVESSVVIVEEGPAAIRDHTHVAIDRFTGGSATSLLWKADLVEKGAVELTIRMSKTLPDFAKPLILLAARDVADGLIGIGGYSSRGYGSLKTEDDLGIDGDLWRAEIARLRSEFPRAKQSSPKESV